MKLNLLPTTVSKGAKARTAWIGSVLMILAGAGVSAFMIISSRSALVDIKTQVADRRPAAEKAFYTSQSADTIIAQSTNLVRNTNLAKAMLAHNEKYPKLYNDLKVWIPSFFRVTSMTATPIDDNTSTVTLLGTLDSYQQYSDLMLALLRFPDAQSVGRNSYVSTDKIVPALTEVDQNGRPRGVNEAPVPDDPLERLAYFQAQGSAETYTGVGNYGTATNDTRLAMPDSSLVQVTMTVSRGLRVPDVRQTLQGGGGGGGTTTAPGLPAGLSGGPSMSGPPPGAGAPTGGGGKGDEE